MSISTKSQRLSRRESRRIENEKIKQLLIEERRKSHLEKRAKYNEILAIKSAIWADAYKLLRKPSGSEIPNGLPVWNVGYIDGKLVYIEPEDEDFALIRGKVGRSLLKRIEGAPFKLDNNIEVPYHPLHDPHMKTFLKYNLDYLLKKGLVTEHEGVQCTLKEYNHYRKYLHRLHSETIKKESTERAQRELEELTMKRFLDINKQFIQRKEKEFMRNGRIKIFQAEKDAERKSKAEKCRKRMNRVDFVLEEKANAKHLAAMEAEKRNHDFRMWLQERVIAGAIIERKRKLNAILQRKEGDRKQREREELNEKMRKINTKKKIEERWRQKVHAQMLRLEKEENILHMRQKDLKQKSHRRQRKIQYWDSRRKELLEKLKKEKQEELEENVRLYIKAKKKFYSGVIDKKPEVKFGIDKIVDRLEIRMRSKCSEELADILFKGIEAKKEVKLPFEVESSITHLLNSVIELFVRKKVSEDVPKLVLHAQKIYKCCSKHLTNQRKSHEKERLEKVSNEEEDLADPNDDHSSRESSCSEQTSSSSRSSSSSWSEKAKHFSAKELFLDSLEYLHAQVIKSLKKNIKEYFDEKEDVRADIEKSSSTIIIESRTINLIEYITVTFLNFAETRKQIDGDVCVAEITDYIQKQILHMS